MMKIAEEALVYCRPPGMSPYITLWRNGNGSGYVIKYTSLQNHVIRSTISFRTLCRLSGPNSRTAAQELWGKML